METSQFSEYTRKELFEYIKNNNLEEDVKEEFGRNMTNVSNKELINFLDYNIALADKEEQKLIEDKTLIQQEPEFKKFNADKTVISLISLLQAKGIITPGEANDVIENKSVF